PQGCAAPRRAPRSDHRRSRRRFPPTRPRHHLRRAGRRGSAARALSRPRCNARRQSHAHRSPRRALPVARDLSRHRRRQGARGVQRQDRRASGRAEDRFRAARREPDPLQGRGGQRQARAGDLRRRRQMRARRDLRPAGRGRCVLPALARTRRRCGPPAPDQRVRARDPRSHRRRSHPRSGDARIRGATQVNAPARSPFDLARIRADFPILRETVRGKRLAYLDNAATTQKPEAVLQALDRYYRTSNANVHRAVHALAEHATTQYEAARDRIARWFNVAREQVVFTRGTTEAVNLVARSFLQPQLKAGDEVLLTGMEHHSNIVPWQLAGAKIVAAPLNDAGEVIFDEWKKLLSPRIKLV